jgi:putative membrane protein
MTDKALFRVILIITLAVPLVVLGLYVMPKSGVVPPLITHCPALNAFLNGTCTVLLISSYFAIRNKKVKLHKTLNVTAFVLSALFLVSYIAYHFFSPETKYPTDNQAVRHIYLFILFSHIILAAVVLPLVLLTFYRGLSNDIMRHRKIARWTMPIWIYVTTTGVIVYLMISPYYRF